VLVFSFAEGQKGEGEMDTDTTIATGPVRLTRGLKFLTPREIYLIDDLLHSVGDFGEVHLKVKGGKLRFATKVESLDALKWEEDR